MLFRSIPVAVSAIQTAVDIFKSGGGISGGGFIRIVMFVVSCVIASAANAEEG